MPWGEAVPELSGHEHFQNIGNHIHAQADGKNDHPFPETVDRGKRCSIDQPEDQNAWIERVDKEPRQGDPGKICFGKGSYHQGLSRIQIYFFEEDIVDPHTCQEYTADICDGISKGKKLCNQFGKEISEKYKEDIADPHPSYKTEASFVSVVDALFDDSEDHRTH